MNPVRLTRPFRCPDCGTLVVVRMDVRDAGRTSTLELYGPGEHVCPARGPAPRPPADWRACRNELHGCDGTVYDRHDYCGACEAEFAAVAHRRARGSLAEAAVAPPASPPASPRAPAPHTPARPLAGGSTPGRPGRATAAQWQRIAELRQALGIADMADVPRSLDYEAAAAFIAHLQAELASRTASAEPQAPA